MFVKQKLVCLVGRGLRPGGWMVGNITGESMKILALDLATKTGWATTNVHGKRSGNGRASKDDMVKSAKERGVASSR